MMNRILVSRLRGNDRFPKSAALKSRLHYRDSRWCRHNYFWPRVGTPGVRGTPASETPSTDVGGSLAFAPPLSCPFHVKLALVHRAISQVEIDETLVRHARFRRHTFEIGNGVSVKAHGDRLFEILDERVFTSFHFAEIVIIPHADVSNILVPRCY